MSLLAGLARLHRLDDAGWQRHANPWSVWTRFAILPAVTAVLYMRPSLGPWTVGLLAVLLAWSWLNPRAFPPPASTSSWAARAVLGERLWLARSASPPPGTATAVRCAIALSAAGTLVLAFGLWRLSLPVTAIGLAVAIAGKLWFLDRMVRLHDARPARATPAPSA